MITINFTFIIELLLFLIFFIFARKFVWRPLLETIKEREDYFNNKRNEIENISRKSNEFYEEYKKKVEQTQKALDTKLDNTIRNAYIQQRTMIEQEQKKAYEQLIQFRQELHKQFCINSAEIEKHAEVLSEKIIQCLIEQKRIF